jgi:hypothetical protein
MFLYKPQYPAFGVVSSENFPQFSTLRECLLFREKVTFELAILLLQFL